MENRLYPLLLKPVYQDYIWGGERIPFFFNREPHKGICAESWEISDRDEGMSIICNGTLAGSSLRDIIKNDPDAVLGLSNTQNGSFPLLIKLIDAKQRLSLQVHPDDQSAPAVGGEAKTEMWYTLAPDEGAKVYAGLKEGVSETDFRQAIESNRLEEILSSQVVFPSSSIFIKGGLVHAIGEGCLLLEIQQNSNTTYRVYDWGRTGTDGQPRELHVEKAVQVIDRKLKAEISKPSVVSESENCSRELIQESNLFTVHALNIAGATAIHNNGSFTALFVENGTAVISYREHTYRLEPGRSCLIPAVCDECTLTAETVSCRVIEIKGPQSS